MSSKENFIELVKNNINREGVDKLLDWLEKTDFYTAPASSKFHNNIEGGLCEHSINTYYRYIKLLQQEFGENWTDTISLESATIISLFHDLCKVDYYKTDYRNVKVNNEWIQKPYFSIEDNLPYGHGEKSVYIVNGFLRLTREEAMAINWHMGGYDARVKGGSYSIADAFYKFPTSLLFHIADLQATYLDERSYN